MNAQKAFTIVGILVIISMILAILVPAFGLR